MCKEANLLPIGSIFAYRKVRLQVVEGRYCSACYFFANKDAHCYDVSVNVVPPCNGLARRDGKHIIFKKVADIEC